MTKDEFAWLSGLQHVSIPASKDHIYLTFDNREHAIAARDQLTGATWDGLKLTVNLVEPEARANRAGSGFVLNTTTSSTASDDDDARSTASGYSDAVSVAAARPLKRIKERVRRPFTRSPVRLSRTCGSLGIR